MFRKLHQRIEEQDRAVAEQIVSWMRLGMVASMIILVAAGGSQLRVYPEVVWWLFAAAVVYVVLAIVKTTRDARQGGGSPWTGWALSAVSAAFVVALVAVTGAGKSPLIPVGITVVIATAIRFDLARSLAVASGMGLAMAAVILWVPQPDVAWGERVRDALWYLWIHVAIAAFVGIFSQVADVARRARARAEAEAEAEHRRLDEEQAMRRRLEAVDAARKDFLLAIAHDFRMPIGSLVSLSTALTRRRAGLDPDQGEMVELIERHARSLGGMLEEVREIAITESLDAPRRVEIADAFMPDVLAAAAVSADVASGRLTTVIDDDLTVLRTDSGKLTRIIANLLEDAARRVPADSPIEVRVCRHGDGIALTVFDRRAREGRAARSPEPGSGLGLWIAAQFVEALGGALESENRPFRGHVIRAMFPPASGVSVPPPVSTPARGAG